MPTSERSQIAHIPSILEEHLDELEVLLMTRATRLRSPWAYLRHLTESDERIQAHTDGVLAAGPGALGTVSERLDADDPDSVRAGAFAALQLRTPGAEAALGTSLGTTDSARLSALADALVLGPGAPPPDVVARLLHHQSDLSRVIYLEVLGNNRASLPSIAALGELVQSESAPVRTRAWRLVGDLRITLDPKLLSPGVTDDDTNVRRETLIAASRCGHRGALAIARRAAEAPTAENADALRLLVLLGEHEDAKCIDYVLTEATLGPLRSELIGLRGSPADVPVLLDLMHDDNPRVAIAAGVAYRRMTGFDVESTVVTTLPPEDGSTPDEFEAEFLEEAKLPDERKAREHWTRVGPTFARYARTCCGTDVSAPAPGPQLDAFDMEARWWHVLRGQYFGIIAERASEFDRFPVRNAR